MIETIVTCPLGHTCQKVVDGHIERCAWYVKMQGSDPSTGQEVNKDECGLVAIPMLLVEVARQTRSTTAATESFRNEMVAGNNVLANLFNQKRIGN